MDTSSLAEEIAENAEKFISLISPLTNKQLNTIPFEGSWTAGQVARHIIKATDGLPDNVTKAPDRPADEQVPALAATFLNFNVKYTSPEFVVPEKMEYDKDSLIADLNRIKAQNVLTAQTKDLSMLCMGFEFPMVGHLTRYEWLKFMVFHTQRHTRQLNTIVETLQRLVP